MTSSTRVGTALVLSVIVLLCGFAELSYARPTDDAVVLPKGYWRLFADAEFYIPFDQKYNNNGDVVPLGNELNANLNSSVFTLLPAGASLGSSVVSYERHLQQVLFQPAYGLTDRFTIGMNIPYVQISNEVNASLNTSTATLGSNPGGLPTGCNNIRLAPIGAPGTTPLMTGQVQQLLGCQGFKPVQTWTWNGFGDIEVGGRYQYVRSENFRAAFTGGVRFPTGYTDDPNNLVDTAIGGGTYALLFRFNQDFMYQKEGLGKRLGFPDPWTGFINTTISYDWNLPNKQTMRVCSPQAPACSNLDTDVNRKLGDLVQAEISGKVGVFFPGLIFNPAYIYGHKFTDAYSGDKNMPYGDLAIDTSQTQHIYIMSLTYTTIPKYTQKTFPFPAFVSLSYRDRFAGTNAVKSQYIGLTAAVFF